METVNKQQVELDPQRQQKAREYHRLRRRLSLLNIGITIIGILFIFWSELYIALRNWLKPLNWQPLPGWYPWQILVYFLVLILGYQILTAPLSYYGSYILPRRYELSTMTVKSWLFDAFKALVLSLTIEAFVIELIYALLAI